MYAVILVPKYNNLKENNARALEKKMEFTMQSPTESVKVYGETSEHFSYSHIRNSISNNAPIVNLSIHYLQQYITLIVNLSIHSLQQNTSLFL